MHNVYIVHLYSTIALFPEIEIQKPVSQGKKIIHFSFLSFSGTGNIIFGAAHKIGEKKPEIAIFFMFVSQAGTNI